MTIIKKLIFGGLFLSLLGGCKEDPEESAKYARPDWLAGKLYTQIRQDTSLSLFARCLERTGYDTIINTSGSYTVFAPDNLAFSRYFSSGSTYASVEDIPLPELEAIVKFHIVQNPWSMEQLKSLDVYGWIDSTDINNDEPKGFKRETLLRDKDPKFGVTYNENRLIVIVDTTKSPWYRRQAMDSRKYAPLFYKEYFDIYDLSSNDYSFYFNRNYDDPGAIHYAGGKITEGDIFAENGFIHVIDRVITPMKNAYQILSTPGEGGSYIKFRDLVNTFPEFTFNRQRTITQPGAEQGFSVDSLFDITYPELAFAITNELTKAPGGTLGLPSTVTIRYHHGLVAPTNEAFDAFVQEYFEGPNRWGSLKQAPLHIKRILANTHMSTNAIYPSDFSKGFYNGEKDLVQVDPATIVQQQYGSNCTFIGVNKMIVPRAFSSITGPIYLQRNYSTAMYAIENSGLLPALKKQSNNYSLYVESDLNLQVDSSLQYQAVNESFVAFQVSGDQIQEIPVSDADVRILLLNHIGVENPKGIARKEFIRNLAGNYLILNNETGEVSGTLPSTIGYLGDTQVKVFPDVISSDADNGVTYHISNWFNFSSEDLFTKISVSYPWFHDLLKKALLTNDKLFTYKFISENEFYTVLIPTQEALTASQVDTLNVTDLQNLLKLHFIQGDLIFTDGNRPAGYYETTRIDEKSTPFTTLYTKIMVNPGVDVIHIPDKNGADFLLVPESETSNIITSRSLADDDTGQEVYPNIITSAVIHVVDKVLMINDLDTQ